ncbi:MAG: putative glycoside hydrolase [Patescibacteria group bacterium]
MLDYERKKLIILIAKVALAVIGIILFFLPFYYIDIDPSLAYPAPQHDYPRLANLYWRTPITTETAEQLAKWNLIALDMQAQNTSPDMIRYIKKLNPKIIILAYTSANEIPAQRLNEIEPIGHGLWHDLSSGIKPQWYLKNSAGKNISWWPGNYSLNLIAKDDNGQTYADYAANFFADKILSTGLWDGLLLDNTWQNVASVDKNIDVNCDGKSDDAGLANKLWQDGNRELFKKIRERVGNQYLIIGNGDGQYHDQINGRMFEGFPEFWEQGWLGSMKKYSAVNGTGYQPRINIVNSDTDNTGKQNDYQTMRFGLASTLMFDGYYSFDFGPQLREHLWWYDEYSTNLGQPKSSAYNLLDANNKTIKEGLWQREFAQGVALVNSTNQTQTVNFNSEYEKIHGTQDKQTNDGLVINNLTLKPQDGIILLRPIDQIMGQVFVNGSFARVFSLSGQTVRTGFFAYDQAFPGSVKIIKADTNGDGELEIIVAGQSSLSIYNFRNEKLATIYPYGEKYRGGISLAVGDLNGDDRSEIVTAPENGQSNLIKIFDWRGNIINSGWNAYNKKSKNLGANVAVCDTNGDGQYEVVTSAGYGGGPHVKIFDKNGKILLSEFFAYTGSFRGGINLACGDINRDGRAEIVTGLGRGGQPLISIFDGQGKRLGRWLAYSTKNTDGIKVVAADIDNNGQAEIISLNTNVFTASAYRP